MTTASDLTTGGGAVRVFVIHSHRDKDIVTPLVSLLRSECALAPGAIRATSDPTAQLDIGSDVDATLAADLREAPVTIALMTLASLESAYVMRELETRRAAGRRIMPLVGPGVAAAQLPLHLQDLHFVSIEQGIPALIELLRKELGIPARRTAARASRALIDSIVAAARRRYISTPVPVPFEELVASLPPRTRGHDGARWARVALAGAELLQGLLNDGGENFRPDLVVALNQGGMITAALLKRWLGAPVGVAFTALGEARDVLSLTLPDREDLNAVTTVLLVDSKLKSGQGALNVMNAMNRLREDRPFAFRLAVLVEYGRWEPPRWSFPNDVRWPALLHLDADNGRGYDVPTYVAYRMASEDRTDPFPEPWRDDIRMPRQV
jgi:hypothetical protein